MLLLKGVLIGLSIAAPVGPIGLLCIQRTLLRGQAAGLVSGLGAASADAIYGALAGFGLVTLTNLLLGWQGVLRLFGGAFLLFLGLRIYCSVPPESIMEPRSSDLWGDYTSTFLLTLTNPVTILAFAGIFAGLGLAEMGNNPATAVILVLGVFLGSLLWWLMLTWGIGTIRHRLTAGVHRWINRLSGAVIAAFGVLALLATWLSP